MKFKRLISFFMIFIFLFSAGLDALAEETEEVTTEYPKTTEYPDEPGRMPDTVGEACIVMDAATGQILYEKNAYQKMYPASITKIMTALLAIENGDMNDTIVMSETAVWGIERGSTHIALDVGEEINFEDALYAVLVVSANEAAWAVAEHIAGTLENFCDMMNQKAEELGCVSTHFVNANGLHDDDHYTCAYDMALITREALKYDKFREITATTYYMIPPTNMNEEQRDLWQDNKLIKEASDFYYEYCEGGKTGFTDEARGTLVAWAKKGDVELIFVTMHNYPTTTSYTDAKAMFEYFFNNYYYAKPLSSYEFSEEDVAEAELALNKYFEGTNDGILSLSVDKDAEFLIKNSVSEGNAVISYDTETINEEEKRVGTISVGDGSEVFMELPVYYDGYVYKPLPKTEEGADIEEVINMENAKKDKSSHKFMKIFMIVIAVLMVALIVLIILRVRYVRRQREIRRRKSAKRRINNRRR